MLVSALETAASHWRTERDPPVEILRVWRPKLLKILREAGGDALVEKVARMIAPFMGSTRKFIDFVLKFIPEPPSQRPEDDFRFDWNAQSLEGMLSKVYDYRSKALHAGIPFPTPMCMAPRGGSSPEEKPLGKAIGAMGSVWLAEDTPILLHLFEHIARGALLRWWDWLLAGKPVE
jgi:hypothetical protein